MSDPRTERRRKPTPNPQESGIEPTAAAGLLSEAGRVGVIVWAESDVLRVRGLRSQETLIRLLLAHKVAVLAVLSEKTAEAAEADNINFNVDPPPPPDAPKTAGPGTSGQSVALSAQAVTAGPEPLAVPMPPANPECEALLAELRDLAGRVVPHWRGYIETRMDADRLDLDGLQTAREWVLKYATIDGVPGPGSVFATPNAPDEDTPGCTESAT